MQLYQAHLYFDAHILWLRDGTSCKIRNNDDDDDRSVADFFQSFHPLLSVGCMRYLSFAQNVYASEWEQKVSIACKSD